MSVYERAISCDLATFVEWMLARLYARGRLSQKATDGALVFVESHLRSGLVQTLLGMRCRDILPCNLPAAVAPDVIVSIERVKFYPHPRACDMRIGVVHASHKRRCDPRAERIPHLVAHNYLFSGPVLGDAHVLATLASGGARVSYAYEPTGSMTSSIATPVPDEHAAALAGGIYARQTEQSMPNAIERHKWNTIVERSIVWRMQLLVPLACATRMSARAERHWDRTMFGVDAPSTRAVHHAALVPVSAVRARFCFYVRDNALYAYVPNHVMVELRRMAGEERAVDESCPSYMSDAAWAWNKIRGRETCAAIVDRINQHRALDVASNERMNERMAAHPSRREFGLDPLVYGFGEAIQYVQPPAGVRNDNRFVLHNQACMPEMTSLESRVQLKANPDQPWMFYWSIMREWSSEPVACYIADAHGITLATLRASARAFAAESRDVIATFDLLRKTAGVHWNRCTRVDIPAEMQGEAFETRWRTMYPMSQLHFRRVPWIRHVHRTAATPLLLEAMRVLDVALRSRGVADELERATRFVAPHNAVPAELAIMYAAARINSRIERSIFAIIPRQDIDPEPDAAAAAIVH